MFFSQVVFGWNTFEERKISSAVVVKFYFVGLFQCKILARCDVPEGSEHEIYPFFPNTELQCTLQLRIKVFFYEKML